MPAWSPLAALSLLTTSVAAQPLSGLRTFSEAAARPASTAPPGQMSPEQTPQFLLVTWDDCVNTASEALVRPLLDGLRNPDGRPVPSTYFVSLEGCPIGGTTDVDRLRARYAAGDELAVHTRTHTTGTHTTQAEWERQIRDVQTVLWQIGTDTGAGFRAPQLLTNPALYAALERLGLLYDSSIVESPFWSPVSDGPARFVWPFTYDAWPTGAGATGRGQLCEQWIGTNACPTKPHTGLWQIPLYVYTTTATPAGTTYLGSLDIGGPEAFSGAPRRRGTDLRRVLDTQFAWRYDGNRAPLNLFFHATGFDEPDRYAVYRSFLSDVLGRGDVWAVTMQGLIEWMRKPVPASEMTAWYADYCQRHPCSPGTATNADPAAASRFAAARLLPSVTTSGQATLHGVTGARRATVVDVTGREVTRLDGPFGEAGTTIDVSQAPPGMYFVRVEGDGPHAVTLRLVRL